MTWSSNESHTDLRGARITGSAIAAGTHSSAQVTNGADGPPDEVVRLVAELRRRLAEVEQEDAGVAAPIEGTVSALERELAAPAPDKGRVARLLQSMMSVSSDVVTLSPVVGTLAGAVGAWLGLG